MLTRIGVLASGGGSNLAALHDYLRAERESGAAGRSVPEIVLVASDQERAGALERARKWGVPSALLADRGADAGQLETLLGEHQVDLIVLAGYLRLVPRSVVGAYRGRIINVHPALLPAFGGAGMYGQRVHSAVIEQGARVSGATVHFVDEDYDRGPIMAFLGRNERQGGAERTLVWFDPQRRRGVVVLTSGRNGQRLLLDVVEMVDPESPLPAFLRQRG